MIALITGTLQSHAGGMLTVLTDGGTGYELHAPLGVFERLPAPGARLTLHTELVVREDNWALYGFDRPGERLVFQRFLGASGFGPRLALALISALGADRAVRAVRGRDIAVLSTVPGIGKKKAERLVLELHDKFDDLDFRPGPPEPLSQADEAVRALTGLGYTMPQAEEAVRAAVTAGSAGGTPALIRAALQQLTR